MNIFCRIQGRRTRLLFNIRSHFRSRCMHVTQIHQRHQRSNIVNIHIFNSHFNRCSQFQVDCRQMNVFRWFTLVVAVLSCVEVPIVMVACVATENIDLATFIFILVSPVAPVYLAVCVNSLYLTIEENKLPQTFQRIVEEDPSKTAQPSRINFFS